MMGLLLSICCLFGFFITANRVLKIPVGQAPFFCVSALGVVLFFFALFNRLELGAGLVLWAGLILLAGAGIFFVRSGKTAHQDRAIPMVLVFAGMVVFSFVIALGMTFTTVDDYVWWGIVGKYLFLYDHLPTPDTTIINRHLGYTPGTALIHYFFHQGLEQYRPAISYFAQNLILISALFVVIKKEQFRQGLFLLAVIAVVLGLFCGSIFTKMQVDYLLSAFFFAILWIYYDTEPATQKLWVLSAPLLFLFLIKEIGFAMSVLLIIIIVSDLLIQKGAGMRQKVKFLAVTAVTIAGLFLLKGLWQSHCQAMGFVNFSGAINPASIKASLDIFGNEAARKGFYIFIKGLFFGEADRLNMPYILWFAAAGFLWYKNILLVQTARAHHMRRLFNILFAAFILWVVMNYFMQLIVFRIGVSYPHTVGLERYLNIYFAPVLLFLLACYLKQGPLKKRVPNKALASILIVFFLITTLSRIETSLRREPHFIEAQALAEKIEKAIAPGGQQKIAVIPGKNDNELWIQLLYYLLPHDIKKGAFPAASQKEFANILKIYDYVLFYTVNDSILKWTAPFFNGQIEPGSFYKVVKKNGEQDSHKVPVTLKRMF